MSVLKPRMNLTGARFIRLLRNQNISLSVFAMNTKVDFQDLVLLKSSNEYVPAKYVSHLTKTFSIEESVIDKYSKAA